MLGDRAAEVDGSERGEYERLQRGDEPDLEQEDRDAGGDDDHAQRLDPEQHGEAAGHEQDDQVPGEDVGEQTNGERDQAHEVRQELEHEDESLHERVVDARRDQARQVAAHALHADALEVVRDEHDEREDERDREVGRRCVERERRDVDAEDIDLLVRVGRQRDVADEVREPDEQEQRPDEREPLARHRVVHVPARDVVAHRGVDPLDGGLHAVRALLHATGDVDHRADRERRGDQQVQHRAREVERAEVDPGVELELVLRLELLVVEPRPAVDADREHDQEQVDAADDQGDALAGAHSGFLSSGRRISVVARWTVYAARQTSAAVKPSSRSAARPTARMPAPISQTRPIMLPTLTPIARRTSPRPAERSSTASSTRDRIQTAAPTAYPSTGAPSRTTNGAASTSSTTSRHRTGASGSALRSALGVDSDMGGSATLSSGARSRARGGRRRVGDRNPSDGAQSSVEWDFVTTLCDR